MERTYPDLAFPGRELYYSATLTNSVATVTTATTYVRQVVLSSIVNTDSTVTFASTGNSASPASSEWVCVLSGQDQIIKDYPEAWIFEGGMTVTCTNNSSVRVQVKGTRLGGL